MTKLDKSAFVLYVFNCLLAFGFALIYLFLTKFMPYHEEATKLTWEVLNPGLQLLLQGLFKITSAGFFVAGFATLIMLFIPYKKNETWSKIAIAVINFIFSIALLYATLNMYLNTGAFTPWPFAIVSLSTTMIAFILNLVSMKKK